MLQDFKFAVRSLGRNPMFGLGAIATLALGIGVNSTIFTLADAALFRAMPGVASPSELVWISEYLARAPQTGRDVLPRVPRLPRGIPRDLFEPARIWSDIIQSGKRR